MFYVIRTLVPTGTKILVRRVDVEPDADGNYPRVYGFTSRRKAEMRAASVPGDVKVYEFKNDSEARMYIDTACVDFQLAYDSKSAS